MGARTLAYPKPYPYALRQVENDIHIQQEGEMRRLTRHAMAGGAAAALAAGTLAGCSTTAPAAQAALGGAGSGTKLQVVAAENFWGSIAAQLGGAHVAETSIISNPDTDPHDYEATA